MEAFVTACDKYKVKPGLYIGSRDTHNRFGSITPNTGARWPNGHVIRQGHAMPRRRNLDYQRSSAFATHAYVQFLLSCIEELLTQYGDIAEFWVDGPNLLGAEDKRTVYNTIASLQPDCLIVLNHSFGDGSVYNLDFAWPSDIMSIEVALPRLSRYDPWFQLSIDGNAEEEYYIPGEVCDMIGRDYNWFFGEDDTPQSDAELLGRRLICHARGVNWLLNVPPNREGVLPRTYVDALQRLLKNSQRMGIQQ